MKMQKELIWGKNKKQSNKSNLVKKKVFINVEFNSIHYESFLILWFFVNKISVQIHLPGNLYICNIQDILSFFYVYSIKCLLYFFKKNHFNINFLQKKKIEKVYKIVFFLILKGLIKTFWNHEMLQINISPLFENVRIQEKRNSNIELLKYQMIRKWIELFLKETPVKELKITQFYIDCINDRKYRADCNFLILDEIYFRNFSVYLSKIHVSYNFGKYFFWIVMESMLKNVHFRKTCLYAFNVLKTLKYSLRFTKKKILLKTVRNISFILIYRKEDIKGSKKYFRIRRKVCAKNLKQPQNE
nr:hypothetical protein 1634Bnrm1_p051 [Cryptomonas sp.]